MSWARRVLLSAGLACSASACTVGPNWKKPTVVSPVAYAPPVGAGAESRPVTASVTARWWDLFGDAELSALERRVAASNLDVKEASSRLVQSRAERRIVSADRLPTSDAQASYARERASPNGILGLFGTTQTASTATVADGTGFGPAGLAGGGSAPFDLWQYGFDVSWELDLWGRVRREIESSDAALEESKDMRRDVLVTVLAETARDYIQLRGVQAQLAITQHNLDIAAHSLTLTQVRLANGVTTQLDVANATAQVASIRSRLPGLQAQAAHLVNALSFMAGLAPRALQTELASAAPIPPLPVRVPVGLPSELAERRPDIRQAEARLHEATAQVGVAVADFYPRVTLSGSLDLQALQLSGLGTWASRQYGLGPSVSLPLFEGGRLRGTLALRKGQQQQAALDYQRTVLKAWGEVDDAMTDYQAAQLQRDRLDEAVQQNQAALAIAQLQYAQGATDFLNVLTVQTLLLNAQSTLVQARTDSAVALAAIYKALGGGWQEMDPVARRAG